MWPTSVNVCNTNLNVYVHIPFSRTNDYVHWLWFQVYIQCGWTKFTFGPMCFFLLFLLNKLNESIFNWCNKSDLCCTDFLLLHPYKKFAQVFADQFQWTHTTDTVFHLCIVSSVIILLFFCFSFFCMVLSNNWCFT